MPAATRRRNPPAQKPAQSLENDSQTLGPDQTQDISEARRGQPVRPKGETKYVTSVFRNKFHPYQQVTIPQTEFVPVVLDNWTQVQLDAGTLILAD